MLKAILLAAASTIGLCCLAHADIIAQLDSPTETGAPGDTLAFMVTLTNTSSTDQIWLNGIGSTASSAVLSIDTDPFNTNAPLFLDPLASSGPFELFDVTIAPGTPDGGYVGSFVTIEGGADGGAGTAFTDLVDVSFDVDVHSPINAVPEPNTLTLFAVGLIALMARRLAKKRERTQA
jgi:hypothetical protein